MPAESPSGATVGTPLQQLIETQSDGGDAGCDYFDCNVVPYAA